MLNKDDLFLEIVSGLRERLAPDPTPVESSEHWERRVRKRAASHILVEEPVPFPLLAETEEEARVASDAQGPRGLPIIDWEAHGISELRPKVIELTAPQDHDPLPQADIVVVTWTSAEWDALHYVFSNELAPLPGSPNDRSWRNSWKPYRRDFYKVFQSLWMRRLISAERNRPRGAPALNRSQMRWGSYTMVEVGGKKVLLFKSGLHINQDGEGLPLVQLVEQIVEDCDPSLVLSVGTSGGVRLEDGLGDTVVTNAGKFHLGDEFGTASFNQRVHRSSWQPPDKYLVAANKLLMEVPEFPVLPPTGNYPAGSRIDPKPHTPTIKIVSEPLLTTDFFEYGTTTNELWKQGCCVEMDDAVVGLVCDLLNEARESRVQYGFLRNISDPVINGEMPRELQTAWAVLTYQKKGLFTSFNSAIGTWAMIAGS